MGEESKKTKAQGEKPLDKMTVKELRAVTADIEEITGAIGMKKDELLAAIKQAKGIIDEEPAPKKKIVKKKLPAGPMTVQQLKTKISELRAQQSELRKAGDRAQLKIMRRRINRLKKMTRRPVVVADV